MTVNLVAVEVWLPPPRSTAQNGEHVRHNAPLLLRVLPILITLVLGVVIQQMLSVPSSFQIFIQKVAHSFHREFEILRFGSRPSRLLGNPLLHLLEMLLKRRIID